MATISNLWQTLFRLAPRLSGSDRELLTHFATTRDQPAFTELVRRHGGLVWGVCRRHLREPADAEDAFQATFLVLATKPHAVRRAESLGAWLHGTAWRVSTRLRQQRGQTLPADDRAAPPDDPSLRDALVALDEELVRLPAKFRGPLTACYLLERTQDEAAGDLGLSVSTVKRRLATGRELLRQRLSRRGVELGAVLAVLALRVPYAPAVLVQTTLTAAALGAASATVSPLVSGVLAMMWQAKLKAWAVGLGLTAASIGGTGYLATTGVGQGPPAPGAGPAPTKGEQPLTKGGERPEPSPPAKDDPDYAESLQFDIDRAKLQIQRADVTIKLDKQLHALQGSISVSELRASSITALQAMEDKLVAERNLKLAERKLAAFKGQPVAPATPMSAELRKLREQRVEAARANWKALCDNTFKDQNFDNVSGWSAIVSSHAVTAVLLESEREAAGTPAEHVAAWRGQKVRLALVRKSLEGKLDYTQAWQLIDAELVAEIRLLELGAK